MFCSVYVLAQSTGGRGALNKAAKQKWDHEEVCKMYKVRINLSLELPIAALKHKGPSARRLKNSILDIITPQRHLCQVSIFLSFKNTHLVMK